MKTVGIIMACIAVIIAFSPDVMRSIVAFVKVGNRIYFAAIARLLLGAALIYAA